MKDKISEDFVLFNSKLREWLGGERISLGDIGARGELDPPWGLVDPEAIQLVGFEPDEAECRRLESISPKHWHYIPKAAGSNVGEIEIHFADVPTCSSVYPPNQEFLGQFDSKHVICRETRRRIKLPCTTLDAVCAEKGIQIDFLKIDTQGFEFEILEGSRRVLETTFGILLETWTSEVHRGQHLTGDVFNFLNASGFELFDVGIAAAWNRLDRAKYRLSAKQQIIGLDLLFFKSQPKGDSESDLVKSAAIAEVYGFPDFALKLLNSAIQGRALQSSSKLMEIRAAIIRNSQLRGTLFNKVLRKARRILGLPTTEFPRLHY